MMFALRMVPRRWLLVLAGLAWVGLGDMGTAMAANPSDRRHSHRLIVELDQAPLAQDSSAQSLLRKRRGTAPNAPQPDLDRLVAARRSEQGRAMARLVAKNPGLRQSECIAADGQRRPLSYVLAFNGFAVETDADAPLETVRRELAATPGVKAVHLDYANSPNMFASLPLIHATSAWAQIDGGMANAGRGVKVASMDAGVHHAAPMFSGDGFAYPDGYPPNGLGETNNNNGKIILSRAYFRDWDPPLAGEEHAWPGPIGNSHGVHTAGTMAGNPVEATLLGGPPFSISGVAPAAWVMSYKVFYGAADGDDWFYSAEGIAALEDILADGAHVLNNSWGGGPGTAAEHDPLEMAALNVAAAGTFVSFSAGNSGPERGTLDHSSSDYVTVASVTTESGGFSAGRLWISDGNGSPTNIPFSDAEFGPAWPAAPTSMAYQAAVLLDPDNVLGCNAWPADAFAGRCAVIQRGICNFTDKVYEAQQAGAVAVIVYNDEARGDDVMTMGGANSLIEIPSAFVGHTDGLALVNWLSSDPDAQIVVHYGSPSLVPGIPNVVALSSSRGPGTGNVLKPDLAAPGDNVLSQGYGTSPGEQRHLEYGAIGGTSMAAPHVAGAAALLRQLHPDWSNDDVKSALMNTARFLDVYLDTAQTQLAQPLDMGAGCIDLSRAIDPGLLLFPPSLSFGQLTAGDSPSIPIHVRSVSDTHETYVLRALLTTGGPAAIADWDALSFAPDTLTLAPGESAVVTATLHTAGAAPGDLQGFLVFSGALHHVHAPAWGAVAAEPAADVLLIDFDASSEGGGLADYLAYYTDALSDLGLSYDILDASLAEVPQAVHLAAYRAILLFTGDNGVDNVSALYPSDAARLTEFANAGGLIVVMGQAAFGPLTKSIFRDGALGLKNLAPSVTDGAQPSELARPIAGAPLPEVFRIDLGAAGDGAGNQTAMNQIGLIETNEFLAYYPWIPWLAYPAADPAATQIVAYVRRDQPVLGRPGVAYATRVFVSSFGLEGVNSQNPAAATRSNLLRRIWTWGFDEPAARLTTERLDGRRYRFSVELTNTTGAIAQTRWSFGDSTPVLSGTAAPVEHEYAANGGYLVEVEVLNEYGNHAVDYAPLHLAETYAEWTDAQGIPADRRAYDDNPLGVSNLVAYATGTLDPSLSIAEGTHVLSMPWRTDIQTNVWFSAESTTNLPQPDAWFYDVHLDWQLIPLGSNRVELRGQPATNPLPAQKSYRIRFGIDD